MKNPFLTTITRMDDDVRRKLSPTIARNCGRWTFFNFFFSLSLTHSLSHLPTFESPVVIVVVVVREWRKISAFFLFSHIFLFFSVAAYTHTHSHTRATLDSFFSSSLSLVFSYFRNQKNVNMRWFPLRSFFLIAISYWFRKWGKKMCGCMCL